MINGTMKARFPIILFLCIAYSSIGYAQNSLPEISIKGFQNKVIISWLNDYEKPVTDIFIQRSFDSLKNFTTIGSVLIPQNKENGFPALHDQIDFAAPALIAHSQGLISLQNHGKHRQPFRNMPPLQCLLAAASRVWLM